MSIAPAFVPLPLLQHFDSTCCRRSPQAISCPIVCATSKKEAKVEQSDMERNYAILLCCGILTWLSATLVVAVHLTRCAAKGVFFFLDELVIAIQSWSNRETGRVMAFWESECAQLQHARLEQGTANVGQLCLLGHLNDEVSCSPCVSADSLAKNVQASICMRTLGRPNENKPNCFRSSIRSCSFHLCFAQLMLSRSCSSIPTEDPLRSRQS